MGKTYNMGAELKDLGVLPRAKTNHTTRYQKYDAPVMVKKSNNYTFDGSVMTKKQQREYINYHESKGKKK